MLFLGAGILTLNSCVYFKSHEIVRDEPHNSQWRARQEQQALAAAAANGHHIPAPTYEKTEPVAPQVEVPQPVAPVQHATEVKPQVTATAPKTTTAITTPPAQVKTPVATTPVAPKVEVPAPVQTTTPAAPAAQPEKKITNLQDITNENGYIPTAKRVPGDPTRLYNPLAPDKTIRILDKNGNPHPAGTKLKVKGTNYMFYVP